MRKNNMNRIYVASSWRNQIQPGVVKLLRELGHEVYDFKNPEGKTGFSWSDVDKDWKDWTPQQYVNALNQPLAEAGFSSDFKAMAWADTCVFVLPAGTSAATEAGWMKGAGKRVIVYQPEPREAELMFKIYDKVITNEADLRDLFSRASLTKTV
jgi:hypothetical protein